MINEALRLLRIFHDYKSKDLAEKLGISQSYLSEIENGKKVPSLELLDKYSQVFNVRISTLMFFAEELNKDNMKDNIKENMRSLMMKFLKLVEKQGDFKDEDE